jgi:hypothetical protein
MNIPKNACPVAYVAIREYHISLISTEELTVDLGFGGVSEDDWQDLLVEACAHRPTTETIHLRGLFSVELVYSELLPRQLLASSLSEAQRELKELRIDRTPAGMEELKALAERYRRKLGARMAFSSITRELCTGAAKPESTLGRLVRTCDILAGCLRRNDTKGVTLVGEHLAQSLYESPLPLTDVERAFRGILSVSASNPIHPWEVCE